MHTHAVAAPVLFPLEITIAMVYNAYMERTILHCDMNGFFASVELLEHPELKNVPMAVCGSPDNRHGIILAKNEEAKKYGIVTAETLWQAKKKCPQLSCVRPHMRKYKHYSRLINSIYNRYTDMVKPFSIDESWLDVSASLKLFGSGREIADDIRSTVREELGLTLSAGVSWNKIFAKMGSDYKKPDATTVISRSNYKDILWPMPVRELFFVGSASAEKLTRSGFTTIGDIGSGSREVLTALLGKQGGMLYDYSNGLDDSPVSLSCERQKIKSVGNGMTFRRDLIGEDDIKTAVVGLSDRICARLRNYELKAGGVKVDIKDSDLKTISRQKQLLSPGNTAEEISQCAMDIIRRTWDMQKPIRLITVTGISLCDENDPQQLNIFSAASADGGRYEKTEKIGRTIDDIRQRYGNDSISFGRTIGNDIGIDMDFHDEEE